MELKQKRMLPQLKNRIASNSHEAILPYAMVYSKAITRPPTNYDCLRKTAILGKQLAVESNSLLHNCFCI